MTSLVSTYLTISFCAFLLHTGAAANKYSAAANKPQYEDPLQFPTSLRELDKPFRMSKLNVLWVKAKNVSIDSGIRTALAVMKIQPCTRAENDT